VIFCLPWAAPSWVQNAWCTLRPQRLNSVSSTTTTTGAPGSSNRSASSRHQQPQSAEGSLLHYAAASNWNYQTHHDRKTACLRGWLERLGVVSSMLHPG
jgi:hypothetical protein